MNKKEVVKRLKLDLGIDIEYITFAIWENKGLMNFYHIGKWLNRNVRIYTEDDYQKIKNKVIELIKKRIIHPKGWKRII